MATSYGSITIVDITDIGEFSVYPKANTPKIQIYDPDANSYAPNWVNDNVVIDPVAYYASSNVTSSASYSWKKREGIGVLQDLGAGETVSSNGRLTISANVLGGITSGLISYVVTATYIVDGITLTAEGQIDFSLVKQGSKARTAKITGRNVFKYNTGGSLIPTNDTITLTGTVNNVSISAWQYKNSSGNWVTYPNSTTGSSLTVDPSDDTFINDAVTIKLDTNDNNVYDLFTITKLRDGAAGQTVVSAVLSNEDQMLPADKNGKVTAYTGATSTLTIFSGSTNVTSQWAITKSYSPSGLSSLDTSTDNNRVDFTSTATTDETLKTYDTASVTFTCTKSGSANIVKTFSLVKIKTGADGVTPTIYSLESSVLAINKSEAGAFTPTKATFNAYQQVGNTKSAYNGRIQFYVNGSSSIDNALNSDVSTRDFTPTSSTNQVKAVLYAAGGNTNKLDEQTVIITSDGATGQQGPQGNAGVNATTLIMGNEADVIPCTSANKPVSAFTISIPFEGYQGITKKATSASAPTLQAETWGSTITPTIVDATTTSAGSITYTIPTTATVPESGQIQLTFTIAATEGNVIVNKIYTWTRSSAAVNGTNAVILQVLASSGTIFENNTGTLTAQGVLYEGATAINASDVTWTWAQYSGGSYTTISSTSSSADVYKNSNGDTLTIKANAVNGYASFRVTATYPKTGTNSKTYTQYISFIDKSDPIQISIHSTIGLQIKNSQGAGAMYARVTRNGTEIDPVPTDIKAGSTYPSSPVKGQKFIKLTGSGTTGTATLMNYNGTSWEGVTQTCTYEWTYRDKDNNVLTSNTPSLTGQFVYIDGDLIDGKITADVKVTVP